MGVLGNLVGIILHMVLMQLRQYKGENAGILKLMIKVMKGSVAHLIVTIKTALRGSVRQRQLIQMIRMIMIGSAALLIVPRPLNILTALRGSAVQLIVPRPLNILTALIGSAAQLIVPRPLNIVTALIGSAALLIVLRPLNILTALRGSAVVRLNLSTVRLIKNTQNA